MSLYNLLFGRNPAARLLLAMLNLSEGDVGRFRDCYLKRTEDKQLRIVVFTRNGGGNRQDYEEVTDTLRIHPNYIADYDDDFDCTYASYEFSVPEPFKATADELAALGGENVDSPMEKFTKLLENLQSGREDETTKRVMEVGKQIFDQISEAKKSDGGVVKV